MSCSRGSWVALNLLTSGSQLVPREQVPVGGWGGGECRCSGQLRTRREGMSWAPGSLGSGRLGSKIPPSAYMGSMTLAEKSFSGWEFGMGVKLPLGTQAAHVCLLSLSAAQINK